jgi:hypothetical protein
MKPFTGILHVHSNHSYDGHNSLGEIAEFARACGYSFLAMSEHSDTFNHDQMALYVQECREKSAPDFLIIPGIEFRCDNDFHLLGLGIRQFTDLTDPLAVSEFIHGQGGLAIIAHPKRNNYQIPNGLQTVVDGAEVWSATYDGRFVPSIDSLKLMKELRGTNESCIGYGGQDLHRLTGKRIVKTILPCDTLDENEILATLKRGSFIVSNNIFNIGSREDVGGLKLAFITASRRLYESARWVRDGLEGAKE